MAFDLTPTEIGRVAKRRPVFISSLYRSSSTFVAAVLSCHPKYFAMSSAVKYLRFCFARYCPITSDENIDRLLNETYQRVSTRWDMKFDVSLAKEIGHANGGGYAGFYDGIMSSILNEYGDRNVEWTEKIAIMWSGIPAFLDMFPNGKVLHIHRDPRSVMASYKKMTNEPNYAYLDTIFNFISSVQQLNDFKNIYGESRICEIRSEDMAMDPERVLQKICAFLEVDFAPEMLDPNKNAIVLGEHWQSNTSFREGIVGFPEPHTKWKEYLTKDEVCFLEFLTQPYLSELGYEGALDGKFYKGTVDFSHFFKDEYIFKKMQNYLKTGLGSEGYRTDPWLTEMKIVFPEKFNI
ncbi:sulfotransferase [Alphaproteobacteria bacterium]|nr:sulfotransferase [Alphaproteobacteria bacterium]